MWIPLFLATTALAAPLAAIEPPAAADVPHPRVNPRHDENVAAIKTGQYDLVLIGDSITLCLYDGGEWEPLKAVWAKHFAPRRALNLGYSGYRTEDILWNLHNGELDFAHPPKVITLLIGTNNLNDHAYPTVHTAEEVFAGTKAIVELIKQRLPSTKILVLRIFPCGKDGDETPFWRKFDRSVKCWQACRKAGEMTAKLADGKQVFWLDVGHVFLRLDGSIDPDLMPDLIHPSLAGAEAWVQAMEPTLASLMGDKPIVAEEPNTAVVPVSKLEENGYDWFARHEEILRTKEAINPDLVVIGDSITHGWGGPPRVGAFAHAQRNTLDVVFPGQRVLNLGFGWDRTQNVFWRIDHGELDGLNPRLVVLNIGTNNTSGTANARENTAAETAEGVRQILLRIRAKLPEAKIALMGIFPREQQPDHPRRVLIRAINQQLAEFGQVPGITFIDLGPKMLQSDGTLSNEIAFDFCHLTDKGYQIWADALTPLLMQPATQP